MKKVTITDREGNVTEVNVGDDDTARHFENLPFESDHIVSVDVKNA